MSRFFRRNLSRQLIQGVRDEENTNLDETDLGQSSRGSNSRCDNWNDVHKHNLISLVSDQNDIGNVVGGNPTPLAWNTITLSFNQKLGVSRSKQQLKDGWKNLKRDFRRYHNLANKSGWGWNYNTNTPEATDEIWDEIIKVCYLNLVFKFEMLQ